MNRATADAVANAFGGEHIIDIDAVSRRLQSAKEAQTAAEAKQKSAVQAEAKAKADADTKQSEADNAVRAYQIASADAAAKKTAADNATSQWDKGGRGFYETYGYNDALGFFDSDSWEVDNIVKLLRKVISDPMIRAAHINWSTCSSDSYIEKG